MVDINRRISVEVMKICKLIRYFPLRNNVRSGILPGLYYLPRILKEHEVKTHVITSRRLGERKQVSVNNGIILHRVPSVGSQLLRIDLLIFSIFSLQEFKRLNKIHNFDLIDSHNFDSIGLFLVRDAEYKRPPTLSYTHSVLAAWKKSVPEGFANISLSQRASTSVSLKMERRVFTECDFLVANSLSTKNKLQEFYSVDGGCMAVVYPGVDTSLFSPSSRRDKLGTTNRTSFTILFVGALGVTKGVRYLLESMPIILRERGDTRLVIVGSGWLSDTFREQVRRMGLNRVVSFLGKMSHFELPRIYNESDVVVLPSLYEPFGKVLIEAMSCKRPVIATRVDGIPEVVLDGKTGLLVQPRDPEAVANAVLSLLSDDSLRHKMGSRGRRRVQRLFTWEKSARELLNIYNRVSGTHRS